MSTAQARSSGGRSKRGASAGAASVVDSVSKTVAAVRDGYEQVSGEARSSFARGRQGGQEWEQRTERYVRQHPIRSLLIFVGIGFVVGRILRHR
jgi:ElaB/YqjD/DUF883 family membrane-anchored ribosome-binding protein